MLYSPRDSNTQSHTQHFDATAAFVQNPELPHIRPSWLAKAHCIPIESVVFFRNHFGIGVRIE